MFHPEFVERLKVQLCDEQTMEMIDALSAESVTSIRYNPIKTGNLNFKGKPVPWWPGGLYLDKRPLFTLDPHLHAGAYYVQEASSMFLGEAVRQVRPEGQFLKVLDLCGAPGGKATQLSSILGDEGLLIANEVIRSRAKILAENITKWGTGNVIVTNNDPVDFSRLPGWFDMVIVDAPCSGEGMFRNSIARQEWSPSNAELCSSRQRRILKDIWPAISNNGIMIYSTCTFNPEENEKNLAWLASGENCESVRLNISDEWGIMEIIHKGIYGYAFYPGRIAGDGFFISVMRKQEPQSGKRRIRPYRLPVLSLSDSKVANDWSSFGKERLFTHKDRIIGSAAVNEVVYHVISNLSIVKPGTVIAIKKGNDYLPDHELALSVKMKPDAINTIQLDYNDAISYLRKDNLRIDSGLPGWILISFESSILGFAKNLVNRLNNYYPTEWRIRMVPR